MDLMDGKIMNDRIINISSNIELTPLFNPVIQTPTNYSVDKYWGKIVEFEPEWFFASDVSENEKVKLKETLRIVIDYFGLYGLLDGMQHLLRKKN